MNSTLDIDVRDASELVADDEIRTVSSGDVPASPGLSYLDLLIRHRLLLPTGVPGLYGRGGVFEDVVERVNEVLTQWTHGKSVETFRFPPAMNRTVLEQSGYWQNCPDQIGTVFSFCGDERSHRRLLSCLDKQEDWTEDVRPTRLTLTPAACYPVYPLMAARGPMSTGGLTVDILSYCFRHEPSIDPDRMQNFRQREFVRMGTPEECVAFREDLLAFGARLMSSLQLPASSVIANDPFFGRAGKLTADMQRRHQLKFELVTAVINPDKPTACASFNYHRDYFGNLWRIQTDAGESAHTACVGFGLERIALCLFKRHGVAPDTWPEAVRTVLWGTGSETRKGKSGGFKAPWNNAS